MKWYIKHLEHEEHSYEVYDRQGQPRYFFVEEETKNERVYKLYDFFKKEIGFIILKTLDYDTVVWIGFEGTLIGSIRLEQNEIGIGINCPGWKITGTPWDGSYEICKPPDHYIKVKQEKYHINRIYSLELSEKQDERMACTIVVSIEEALINRKKYKEQSEHQ